MNVFKALFSGDRIFKEEFASSFLGYLLSPFNDHGFQTKLLVALLERANKRSADIPEELLEYLKNSNDTVELFMESPFDGKIGVSLEYQFADIVIYVKTVQKEYVLIFENKIYDASEIDIQKQLNDYKRVIEGKKPHAHYLLFAIHAPGWRASAVTGDGVVHLAWANSPAAICIVDVIKECLPKLPADAQSILRQFICFVAENDPPFSGLRPPPVNLPRQMDVFLSCYSKDSDAATRDFIREFIGFSQKNNGFSEEQCDWDGPILMLCANGNPRHACWPFKIKTNGKLQIQWQGLKKEPFSYQKGAPDNIIEKIRERFNRGLVPENRFTFDGNALPLREIANNPDMKARFWQVVAWLQQCLDRNHIIE